MPFTKFTNLDYDQIRISIKEYLRANSNFTDFDFEGSNFAVLIDTLAYNTYINAFNANLIVNESFLDSATLRENVVSLARNIGYVPRSRSAAKATVSFTAQTGEDTQTMTLEAGLVCVGATNNSNYIFSVPESITTTVSSGTATFNDVTIFQGTYLKKQFVVDGSLDQRFILDNSFIDTSTIVVKVKGLADSGEGREYSRVDNILNLNANSEIYLIQEVQDEKYELLFGDGYFGKKLENGAIITVSYIITDGIDGNGASNFAFSGRLTGVVGNATKVLIPTVSLTTNSAAANGGSIESVDSIKHFAPRIYSSQYRAVTGRDYEAIIQSIYPNTESVSVVGGEELDPPQFGTVLISIKPKNGDFISDFDKQSILTKLKVYAISGINQQIVDLKVLYVEINSGVYYDSSKFSNVNALKSKVVSVLNTFASSNINQFGGRFKYSKLCNVIDNSDVSITSNITKVIIRRNLKALINRAAQYELCFGNKFHINKDGFNIKSTGFGLAGKTGTFYFTDVPGDNGKGVISVVKDINSDGKYEVVVKSAGTVDYTKGEILLNTLNITSTEKENNIVEIQAFPESNDIIGLKDLYLNFSVADSSINMVKDTITSGEQVSGVGYKVTSSYSNGALKRG